MCRVVDIDKLSCHSAYVKKTRGKTYFSINSVHSQSLFFLLKPVYNEYFLWSHECTLKKCFLVCGYIYIYITIISS